MTTIYGLVALHSKKISGGFFSADLSIPDSEIYYFGCKPGTGTPPFVAKNTAIVWSVRGIDSDSRYGRDYISGCWEATSLRTLGELEARILKLAINAYWERVNV